MEERMREIVLSCTVGNGAAEEAWQALPGTVRRRLGRRDLVALVNLVTRHPKPRAASLLREVPEGVIRRCSRRDVAAVLTLVLCGLPGEQ